MKTTARALIFGLTLAAASQAALAGAYDDLIAAVYRDDTDAVMGLVRRGMDVNSVDPAGNTLLHIAARNGNDMLLKDLLAQHANPNARNRVGDTPLMLAAYTGKLPAADALLSAGADLNQGGWTPLHYAVFAEQVAMVEHLLQKGADVNARAPNQQTPLMLVAKNGNLQLAKLLIAAKADASLTDQNGDNVVTLARKANNTDLIQMLERMHVSTAKAEVSSSPLSGQETQDAATPQPTPVAADK